MKREPKLIDALHMGIAFFWLLATLLVGVGLSANPAEAQPFAYVTNFTLGTVSVIDTNPDSEDFNKVVSTIELGSAPQVIAFTPDGTRAYVAAGWPDAVLVIDTDPNSTNFNTVIATIPDILGPYAIAFTPDGTRAYVGTWTGTVSVIDTDPSSADFNKVVSTIEVGRLVSGVVITRDGTRAYVSVYYDDRVLVINTDSGSADFNNVVAEIEVPYSVFSHIAITPDSTRAYVAGPDVSVIDTDPSSADFNSVVATIMDVAVTLGGYYPSIRSESIAISPDGTRAYMTDHYGNSVAVIDTATNTHIDTITNLSSHSVSVAITADGSHVYVAGRQTVQMINTADNSLVDTIPMEDQWGGIYWVAIAPSVAKNKGAEVSFQVSCRKGANCTRGNSSAHRMDTTRRN